MAFMTFMNRMELEILLFLMMEIVKPSPIGKWNNPPPLIRLIISSATLPLALVNDCKVLHSIEENLPSFPNPRSRHIPL